MYPKKTEILSHQQSFPPKLIDAIIIWKEDEWLEIRKKGEEEKFKALTNLVTIISEFYNKPICTLFRGSAPTCSYNPFLNTIIINSSLSIISTLHEVAHGIFGPNELNACSWSVKLFKKTFPKAYSKLRWKGHMLIRKK